VRIGECPGATATDHRDPRSLEVVDELLLLVQLVDRALSGRQQRGQVQPRAVAAHPVVVELLRIADEAGGLGKDAGRRAAVIGAGPARPVPLHECHPGSQLRRPERGRDPCRTAADDRQFECLNAGTAHRTSLRGRVGAGSRPNVPTGRQSKVTSTSGADATISA
jgi:hypothetical protein